MQFSIKGKNFEVTPAIREYIEKKLTRLGKYFSEIKEAKIGLSQEKNSFLVEALLEGDGVLLRGEERSDTLYACIDLVAEKLEHRVRKFKGKLLGRSQVKGSREKEAMKEKIAAEADTPDVDVETEGYEPNIARVKRFPVKPISPEDAARQMELLHHDFFVFVNAESEQISVIYRRKEGGYGLLEPDF